VRYIFLLLASLVSATALGQTDSNERSDSVVSELSNRSNIPETELRELLSDCSKNQMSTNICMFYSFVDADLKLSVVLKRQAEAFGPSCRATLMRKQKLWELKRDQACNRHADDEAKCGAMRPMIFSSCRTAATETRTRLLAAAVRCAALLKK
jgi:uncharacterized protein YecT (DUF1311 family)